jgi:uncharacterized coiled-coil protein SlyX
LGNPINPANRDVVEQQQQIQRTQEAFARTLEQLSMERSVNAGCMLQIERELAERELMLSAIEDKCQKQGDKLLATINRNKEENKQWQLEKQKLQARVNQQQQQLDTLSEEVSRCRRQCQQAQEKNAKQQEALNELRQSLYAERAKTAAAYRGKAEQAKAYKDEIREKARYIACLEAKVRRGQLDTKVGAAEYEDEKAELTIRIAQATEQINALEQKMQSLQEAADKERDNGAHIIEQLEIKKSEALNRIRQLEQEMEVQSQNIAELNKQCREQDTVIQELTNTLRRSNANGREKEIQCSTERTQLRADIYAFRRQADIWRERTLEQLDEYMRMTGERNRKEAAILQENRELHTRSEALLRDAAAHDVEVLKQQEETEHLRQEYEHLQQECEHLRQNLNLQQQENEKFRNQELALKQLRAVLGNLSTGIA